jgi:hypothetical protein
MGGEGEGRVEDAGEWRGGGGRRLLDPPLTHQFRFTEVNLK